MIKNRKGSYTVFIMMMLGSMVIFLITIISFMGREAVNSTVTSFGRLWGRSILAEYDVYLKDRYGLFAYYGNHDLVLNKLTEYAEYSFHDKKYISYDVVVGPMDEFLLLNSGNIKGQIAEAVAYRNRPACLENIPQNQSEFGTHRITSPWILENLPSYGMNVGVFNLNAAAQSIKSGTSLEKLIGNTAVNQYILTYFRHNQSGEAPDDTYFKNELEYIITGKADDKMAFKNTRNQLVLLRNILNLAYLYSSSEKRDVALALATALTPGPEAVVTQGVLMEAWAYAEAENDIRLMLDGKSVPLLKKNQNWALTLDNAMNQEQGEDGKAYILPPVTAGESYETYLRILVNLIPEDLRIARAMDLIQINMKYVYCDWLNLKDLYVGISYSITVNGEKQDFRECY